MNKKSSKEFLISMSDYIHLCKTGNVCCSGILSPKKGRDKMLVGAGLILKGKPQPKKEDYEFLLEPVYAILNGKEICFVGLRF